jgi:hypothetical protein
MDQLMSEGPNHLWNLLKGGYKVIRGVHNFTQQQKLNDLQREQAKQAAKLLGEIAPEHINRMTDEEIPLARPNLTPPRRQNV